MQKSPPRQIHVGRANHEIPGLSYVLETVSFKRYYDTPLVQEKRMPFSIHWPVPRRPGALPIAEPCPIVSEPCPIDWARFQDEQARFRDEWTRFRDERARFRDDWTHGSRTSGHGYVMSGHSSETSGHGSVASGVWSFIG
eukprot:CAMPEP_0184648300 /NCGR_PEP_ID=MMETSP0308-20130426/5388_1 /TAXON_ID=38269 /ORGANISM="Gloeochaete witrockiana, Strain SAG 46.84" /LENGTH=139 /DNA_ID=CAMNT_0027080021 /DNA_START=567 /DNA_END=986 /DNA_ORIENTATION=-